MAVAARLRSMTKNGHTVLPPSLSHHVKPKMVRPPMNILPIDPTKATNGSADSASIARAEFSLSRTRREAKAKGHLYLTQLSKTTNDIEASLTILAAARRQFVIAEDEAGVRKVNGCHVKIKGDDAMARAAACRAERNYEEATSHVSEALFHFKVLAGVTSVDRDMSPTLAGTIEQERRFYLTIRNPRLFVKKWAIADGTASRTAAIQRLDERRYDDAKVALDDATVCFAAANVDEKETGLKDIYEHITLSNEASFGDTLLETIAAALKPVATKDYPKLLRELQQAREAYSAAYDAEGVKVVARMKNCLAAIRAGDVAWYNLAHALASHDYFAAASSLISVRKCLYQSAAGLPVINSDLDKLVTVVLNEKLPSITMIAELAMQDGENFKQAAHRALDSQNLDKAASLATKAAQCYEWILDRKKALLNPPNKEIFACSPDELNLDIDDSEMQNVPDTPLTLELVDRFTSTFHITGVETFEVSIPSAMSSLDDLSGIQSKVSENNALRTAESKMKLFYDQESKDNIPDAFESLDEAKSIYEKLGFPTYANDAQNIRYNTMADLAMDQAEDKIAKGPASYASACSDYREAMRYYGAARNEEMFKGAERALMCCEGDQVLRQFDAALKEGDYDAAQNFGAEGVELYRKSHDPERLALLGDPETVVLTACLKDAESFKSEALSMIETKNLVQARTLAIKAKECLRWSGNSTNSIDDIFSVIKMAEWRWKGDELMDAAMACVDDHDRTKSHEMLKRAKQSYSEAQATYQELMGRAAEIISTNEEGDASFGLELQDNIINLYNVCRDGLKLAKLDDLELCLRADEALDKLGTLVKSELFTEARLMIEEARKTYALLGLVDDSNSRVKKTSTLLRLVENGYNYFLSIEEKRFEEGKVFMSTCKKLLAEIAALAPKTIRELDADIFGNKSAEETVIERALTSGEGDIKKARACLAREDFTQAKERCAKAMESYQWVSKYIDWDKISGKIEDLQAFIREVKRAESLWFGNSKLAKATESLEEDKFSFAILTLEQAIADFKDAEQPEKTREAELLKARARGQLSESQSRELWEGKDFEKALEKALSGLAFFEQSENEDRRVKMLRFVKRVEGDLIMTRFPDALKEADWDRATKLMTDAHACYNQTSDPRKMAEIEGADPKMKVKEVAMKRGEDLKLQAGSILHKTHDAEESQRMLDSAKVCFLWCDISLVKAGVTMIQKDIDSTKMKSEADSKVIEAFDLFESRLEVEGGMERCLELLADAKSVFKLSGPASFKQASDLSVVMNVLNNESSTKEAESFLDKGEIMDALHFCSEVCDTWTSVVRISKGGSVGIAKFVTLFEGKEKQLSLVKNVLKKYHEIDAEISGNKWNPPPVELCGELMAIYENLKSQNDSSTWWLDCRFEYIEKLAFEAEIKCGLRELPQPEYVEPEPEPIVEAEPSLEVILDKAVDDEEARERADAAAGVEEEAVEELPSVVESVGSIVVEDSISAALNKTVERLSPAPAEDVVADEVAEDAPAEIPADAAAGMDYEDEVFEESSQDVVAPAEDLVVAGGDIETIDATNVVDGDKAQAPEDEGGAYVDEQFEEGSLESGSNVVIETPQVVVEEEKKEA
jgi:hypothetical protein